MTLASIVAIPVAQRKPAAKQLHVIGSGAKSPCGHLKARFTECGTFERACLDAHCLRSYTVTVRPASERWPNKFTAQWEAS